MFSFLLKLHTFDMVSPETRESTQITSPFCQITSLFFCAWWILKRTPHLCKNMMSSYHRHFSQEYAFQRSCSLDLSNI